jgi:hypothetical protein
MAKRKTSVSGKKPRASSRIKINNLADNEEISKKFVSEVYSEFSRVSGLREQFEETWKVADYMHKCAQNRTVNSSEKIQGANQSGDNRANLGSTLFHRQVNQMASQGVSVELSRPMPFKYEPIVNPGVQGSAEKGEAEANQMNSLIKYSMKKDKYRKKTTDFWFSLCKYGNIAYIVDWKLETKNVKVPVPKYETTIDPTTQEEISRHVSTDLEERDMVVAAHPEQRVLNISQLYADPYIGSIQDQTTVIVISLVHKADIYNLVRNGIYSEKAYEKIDENFLWDGNTGSDFKQDLMDNLQKTWDEGSVSDQYLKWDIYHRAPISGDKWDSEETVPSWHYSSIIGNDISSGIVMTIMRNPDPDDEVPIEMINLYPDDSDLLYHVSPAEIVRSNYSVECTLKELAVDNMAIVNRPPISAMVGMHNVKDFTFKANQLWQVYDQNAIKQFEIRDNTQATISLLEYIQQDSRVGLGTDKNQLGESYGGRTTLGEASYINAASATPSLVWIGYVIEQKVGFYARKCMSLWKAFGTPEIIEQITDYPLVPDVYPSDIKGEFDIEINIVGEYKDDVTSSGIIRDLIRMVAQAPQLLQSETHQVDIGEMMRDVFAKSGLNGDKYIITPQNGDAGRIADGENIAIMQNGIDAVVNPDDNDIIHLRKHNAERLRYSGIEDQFPNIQKLDVHIQQHNLNMTGKSQAGQQAQQAAAPQATEVPQTAQPVA